jgi:hypothetical protein
MKLPQPTPDLPETWESRLLGLLRHRGPGGPALEN